MQRFSIIPYQATHDERLSDSEYRTLGVIAAYSDRDGYCYPSQATLAEKRGVSRKTIIGHVAKLCELGYVEKQARRRNDGGQTSNLMRVIIDHMPRHDSAVPETPEDEERDTPCHAQGLHPLSPLDVTPPVTSKGYTNIPTNIKEKQERVTPPHAPASLDDLMPTYTDPVYRDGMTKADYVAAKEAEIDALAPYEKAIRAVISQSRITGDNYTLLGDTAKAYRDAGLTPNDIRLLWSTNSGSFWKAHTVGGGKPNSGKPWLGNVSSELSRAVEFLSSQAGATEAVTLYREWIQPLAAMNGTARDYFKGAPSQVKRALSANGMGTIDQIKRVGEADFVGWYAGVK